MDAYRQLIFPCLRQLDPEAVHDATVIALALAQRSAIGRWLLRTIRGPVPFRPVMVGGLTFPNVLGIAAGFDKEARVAPGLAALGFGHVEVGTLTPYPQAGNPRPRVFRLPADRALINRMGFPNQGIAAALLHLRRIAGQPRNFVLGVSLGKQRETPLGDAARDYVAVMEAVYPFTDYLAVNVSSPNTPGLRALQDERYLASLLSTLDQRRGQLAERYRMKRHPLWLKVAPDLSDAELEQIVAAALDAGIDGIIATNTTTARPDLRDPLKSEDGGLSGAPLAARSLEVLATLRALAGPALPLISVGGIFSAADVAARLAAGASLVQIYTGLVYEGPAVAGRILRGLASSKDSAGADPPAVLSRD
jgi:dihydroorotate dehydrogenase